MPCRCSHDHGADDEISRYHLFSSLRKLVGQSPSARAALALRDGEQPQSATHKRIAPIGISCVRLRIRGCPATATDLRAAVRHVCPRATRRNISVSVLFQTRCITDPFPPAICRFACGPLKYSSPFHFADRGRASARYPSVPCRRAWRGFAQP